MTEDKFENDIKNLLFEEKYRPQKIDDLILSDDLRNSFKSMIQNQEIPNMVVYGKPGCGKSSLVRLLLNTLRFEVDSMKINASSENGIDVIRDKVIPFITKSTIARYMCVYFEEADYLTQEAQAALNDVLEEHNEYARFIFICNDVNRLRGSMSSRLQFFDFDNIDNKESLIRRIKFIMESEKLQYNPEELSDMLEDNYPDLRKIIQSIDRYTINGNFIYTRSYKYDSYMDEMFNIIIDKSIPPNQSIMKIHQLFINHNVKMFDHVFDYLLERIDKLDGGNGWNYVEILNVIGDHNMYHTRCVNKLLNILSLISKLISIVKK